MTTLVNVMTTLGNVMTKDPRPPSGHKQTEPFDMCKRLLVKGCFISTLVVSVRAGDQSVPC